MALLLFRCLEVSLNPLRSTGKELQEETPEGELKMRVFVAGATGAIGRRLVALLARKGSQVTGMTRTPEKAGLLRALGAEPVVADALDAAAVMTALREAAPQVVVHELTAI